MFNARMAEAGLPLSVAHVQTIWTILYSVASPYNWMLQYYLRAHGLALSWVGTGRLIFSLDIDDTLFADICDRFVAAGQQMRDDGWWWTSPDAPQALKAANKAIRRRILKESLAVRLGRGGG